MRLLILLPLVACHSTMFQLDSRFQLEQSKDKFGMRSHGIIETLPSGGTKFYPLPQSTAQDYMRLRPADLRLNPFDAKDYERQEGVGPHQVEGDKIWFGKEFYHAEGWRGVGAFGYFDTATRRYTLFSPPAVAPYEVSAILVEPRAVWLGLDDVGEGWTGFGGLVRSDRTTHAVRRYPLEDVIDRISRQGYSLRLETRDGYALLHDGKVQRFSKDGRPIDKFPNPPSLY